MLRLVKRSRFLASQSRPSAIGIKQADFFLISAGRTRHYSRRRLLPIAGLTNQETKGDQETAIAYARVSTNEQKEDLSRQIELLDALLNDKIERLVITHKDRLLRC